jgi:hypothetical protein
VSPASVAPGKCLRDGAGVAVAQVAGDSWQQVVPERQAGPAQPGEPGRPGEEEDVQVRSAVALPASSAEGDA